MAEDKNHVFKTRATVFANDMVKAMDMCKDKFEQQEVLAEAFRRLGNEAFSEGYHTCATKVSRFSLELGCECPSLSETMDENNVDGFFRSPSVAGLKGRDDNKAG